jgi:hypothetical protein
MESGNIIKVLKSEWTTNFILLLGYFIAWVYHCKVKETSLLVNYFTMRKP